jgi:hypothetical protein
VDGSRAESALPTQETFRTTAMKPYDRASAQRYCTLMSGDDPGSENGQKVIQYLTTVLGR